VGDEMGGVRFDLGDLRVMPRTVFAFPRPPGPGLDW
jgi:hypothetical protein